MSSTIVAQSGGSSFEVAAPVAQSQPEPEVEIELTETTPPEDTVEISQDPPQPPVTYGPPDFADRFRFDIENGMLERRINITALRSRTTVLSSATYESRASFSSIVSKAGTGSAASALFALSYQDADPESQTARGNVEARSEFNRQLDQNMALLDSL